MVRYLMQEEKKRICYYKRKSWVQIQTINASNGDFEGGTGGGKDGKKRFGKERSGQTSKIGILKLALGRNSGSTEPAVAKQRRSGQG